MKPDPGKIVVSYPSIPVACADCGDNLSPFTMATRRAGNWICLECADLDHLVYLPRGDTALTRRATEHSNLSAAVYRFSKSRKRNERQGTLVEESALGKAEAECMGDEQARALARERAAVRREKLDDAYIKEFANCIGTTYPGCPAVIRDEIARHACEKHSGRVGRSAAAKQFSPKAVWLAVRAHVRHSQTRYDGLLMLQVDRGLAREKIAGECGGVLAKWEKPEEYFSPDPPDWTDEL